MDLGLFYELSVGICGDEGISTYIVVGGPSGAKGEVG